MKKILMLSLFLAGCGYESRNNELVGQVKKVVRVTPLICGNYKAADISLGIMRNGTGSMSHEDIWVLIKNDEDFNNLKEAAGTGIPVKIIYDVKRISFCTPPHQVISVEPAP